jgi:fibronectin type 3 domain-containing protein
VLKAPITGNTVGAYASIATLPANTTGYTDAAASAASSYEVVAFNNAGTATSTPWVEISAPAVPTGLAALVNPTGTVRLTWNKVTGATSYVISSNGAAVTTVAAAGGGGTTQNTTITLPLGVNYTNITIASQLVFTGVTPSVTATSAASAPVSANLSAPAAPAAPTGLGVVYTAQATTATLNWTDSVTAGVTGYVVQQSINGGAWTQVGNVLGATAKTVNVTVANGNTYQYQVFAQSYLYAATNFTNSAAAGPVSLVTTPALPATVTNVAAAAASTSSINVSWTASATAGVTYVVQRKTGNGNFATITAVTSTAGTTISFTDKGLTAGSTYQYQVQAVATNTAGSTSSAFVASTSVSLAAPRVPTFAASTTVTTTGFTANWTAPTGTPAAASYLVSVNGAAAVSQTTTSIAVSGLTAGSTNTVTVAACSTGGVLCSTTASLTQATLPAAPAAPTASALAATTLTLTWTPVTGATSYTVQRATNAAFTTGVATAAGTFTGASLAVTGLTANTTYYFRVTAVNAGGSSAAGTVSAATLTAPAVPTGVTAANGTTGGAITGGLNFTVVTGLTYKLNSTGIAGGSAAVTTSGQQVTFATGGNNQVTLTATNASGSATSAAVTVNAR